MLTPLLLTLALVALVVSALEVGSLLHHLAKPPRRSAWTPTVSVLKPLCGRDANLEENLGSFLAQDYPRFELLLGVRDAQDAAYPLACELAAAHPHRVRVHLQEGEPGLNPKVNQLVTLGRHAQGEVLVISDSNVRAPPHYLPDLVAALEDEAVGMVTSPIAGEGTTLGGRLDALHLHTYITPAVLGCHYVARQDLFVGKSMALRRTDLERVGGFRAFSRLLAEDHALGRAMLGLGKRAALGRVPVVNVTNASVRGVFDRYARWGLMGRWVARAGYPAEVVTYPLMLAALALATNWRQPEVVAITSAIALAKVLLDALAIHALTGRWPSLRTMALGPLKEVVMFAAFLKPLFGSQVQWRGKVFYVTRGTRLMSEAARTRLLRLRSRPALPLAG